MAFQGEDINKVRQRCRINSVKHPGVAEVLRALFKHFNDALRNPDLQWVGFSLANAADTVICNGPCKLYFVLAVKAASSVDSWVKGSNNASAVVAAGDVVVPLIGAGGSGRSQVIVAPDGIPLSLGLTLASHTAVATAVRSADIDTASGFAIIGGA